MCGRYALALSNEEVYESLQNQLPQLFNNGNRPRWERQQDYRPNYNVAPRQRMPVVHRDQNEPSEAVLETMQWGLIPHWTKHPPTAPLNTINARSEALLDSSSGGMWNALKGYKRCVIPVQGYYEWQKKSPTSKVAHFTRLPFATKDTNAKTTPYPLLFLAGLYDVVKYTSPVESRFKPSDDPEDTREPYPTGNPVPLATYTILTTTPAKDLAWLHDRMPCMLEGWDEVQRWLDLGEVKGWVDGKGGTGELLKGKAGLECYPVPPEVGKVGTNSPTFIEPVSERSDGIKSFFQKQSPAKPKPKSEAQSTRVQAEAKVEHKAKEGSGREVHDRRAGPESRTEVKEEAKGIKEELSGKDEKQLGDDSNAPNTAKGEIDLVKEEDSRPDEKPTSRTAPSLAKRKRSTAKDDEEEAEEVSKKTRPDGHRQGGHQTRVLRRESDDTRKEQPAITSFFASPTKPKEAPVTANRKPTTRSTRSKK